MTDYIVNDFETYPARAEHPPAKVNGWRVTGWAEGKHQAGSYPGGIVLAERETRGRGDIAREFVTWLAYTRDGGENWSATGGHYFANPAAAWLDFCQRAQSHADMG